MIVNNSTLIGTIFLMILIIFNFIIFVKNSKYLIIETYFEANRDRYKNAFYITFLYFVFVVTIVVLIGFNSSI